MKILAIQKEHDCSHYSEEDDLSCGVMLKCSLGLKTRWEKGHITYKIPKKCPLSDAPQKIYIVIGYDSIRDTAIREEIKSVWFNEAEAEQCKKRYNYIRVEEHKISDYKSLQIVSKRNE